MIYHMWEALAYMVQLIAASLVFMAPVRKREHYPLRIAGGALVLLILAYGLNCWGAGSRSGPALFLYWLAFLLLCIPFVWLSIDGSPMEAVYCTICASAMQHISYDLYAIYRVFGGDCKPVYALIYVVVYSLIYYALARKIGSGGRYTVGRADLFPMLTIILFVTLLSTSVRAEEVANSEARSTAIYLLSDALCCLYVLWQQASQRERLELQRELDGINYTWHQQQAQFQMTQETIDTINRKCHDLRHQIRRLAQSADIPDKEQYFQEIEDAIMIYDTALKTGNAALDTVLMEKGLFCKSHNIQWTCMADGTKLNCMEPEDIYAMFGNALDNAISAVMELSDPLRRIISVKVVTQGEVLIIQIQNYYDKELRFKDGIPETTKDVNVHGYGMKSLRYTAEKYNGTMSVTAENQIFNLQILLPL